jgi:hypothetical protein
MFCNTPVERRLKGCVPYVLAVEPWGFDNSNLTNPASRHYPIFFS